MRKLALPAVALAACFPLAAQADHFTSSPQGYEGVEGNFSVDLIGKEPLLRFQQVDAFTYGTKHIDRLGFRRDGLLPSNPAYGARTIEAEIVYAESDLSQMSTSFAGNYDEGVNTVVFARKPINLVDWSAAPALPPQAQAQWNIIFTDFLWEYPGRTASGQDFLWEFKVWSNTKAGSSYPFDADTAIPTSVGASGSGLGTGCVATGQVSSMSYSLSMANFGTHFDLAMSLSRAEASQPAFALLGGQQLTASLGLCADLQLVPLTSVAMGSTSPAGSAQLAFNGLSHNAALIGQSLYGQAVAFDTTLGVALSQGRALTVPVDPPSGVQVKHMWALDPGAGAATSGLVDGGIILHSNHP